MNELRTGRVVVIDDDYEEASLLLTALNKLRISSLYYNGDQENFPDNPLEGIRIIFLDLRLMISSPSPEPRLYIPHTISVLKRIINIRCCMAGIIYWTKHEDDKMEFERQLTITIPEFQPSFLLGIKNKVQICDDRDMKELIKKIQNRLKFMPTQRLLWTWEQLIHDTASNTTNQLSQIAFLSDEQEVFDKKLFKVLNALFLSAGGTDQLPDQLFMNCFFENINLIQRDQFEYFLFNHVGQIYPKRKTIQNKLKKKCGLNSDQTSHLNSILLTSKIPPRKSIIFTGNIYISRFWKKKDIRFPFDKRTKSYKDFLSKIWSNLKNNPEHFSYLKNNSIPCLVDITPLCDYVNENTCFSRLLGGILLKSTGDVERDKKYMLSSRNSLFAKEIEFCNFKTDELKPQGNYRLVINARNLYSFSLKDIKKQKAVFRLRHQVITDIQAWFASHAARPGYLSVR